MYEKYTVYPVCFDTPDGEITIPVHHIVEAENEYEDNMHVTVSALVKGEEICFEKDNTEYTFAGFINQLPENWNIKCCFSCRHGNFCPTGDYDNEIFCVSDFAPKQARDLWHVTEDNVERELRSRTLFGFCDRFEPQSGDYYSYSNYLDHVNKRVKKEPNND